MLIYSADQILSLGFSLTKSLSSSLTSNLYLFTYRCFLGGQIVALAWLLFLFLFKLFAIDFLVQRHHLAFDENTHIGQDECYHPRKNV